GSATPGVLWGVQNGPSTLYRLVRNGSVWTPDPSWTPANPLNGPGKALRYPDGSGDPDSEGVTFAQPPCSHTAPSCSAGIYVSTERDNNNGNVSMPEILRFDPNDTGTTLIATNEWNLKSDPGLPAFGPNLGFEGITWVPDSFLVSHHFLDEHKGGAYN